MGLTRLGPSCGMTRARLLHTRVTGGQNGEQESRKVASALSFSVRSPWCWGNKRGSQGWRKRDYYRQTREGGRGENDRKGYSG